MGYKRGMRFPAGVAVALFVLSASGCRDRARSPGPGDRPWTAADFKRVAATTSCGGLPTFGSPGFARMTDPSAIADVAPPGQPFVTRLPALMDYQVALAAIFKRYAMACGDPRAALVMDAALIELVVLELPLFDQFLAGFAPDDPTYATRVHGRDQVVQGLVAMATGAALTVRGTDFTAPLPGVGLRLGTALARAQALLPADTLAGAVGNLDVPADLDDNAYRRALRTELRAGLHRPLPAAPR